MDDMNNSRSSTNDSRYYEQLRVMIDMKDFRLCAQGSRCNE